jgi:multisubunit Na+/H+ antiporter MnhB subunit
MLESWGFTAGEITLFVGVTGLWNIFAKLGMPAIALALLAITGHSNPGLVAAAVTGIVILAIAVAVLVLVFTSEAMARKVGSAVGRVLNAFRRLLRKPPTENMDERAATFRRETIVLASRRWFMLTWTTLLSQIALFFVLLLALRNMGVSEQEVSAVEVFAVYTFARLASAHPRGRRRDRARLHRRAVVGRQRREGPDRRRGADLPVAHLRTADPARRGDVRDLAPDDAVVQRHAAGGVDRGGARGRTRGDGHRARVERLSGACHATSGSG